MTMNEKELAEWFERRRGDTSLWSETPAKADVRRGGSTVFSLRFSPEELALFRRRAEEWGTTISHLIRSAALEAVGRPSQVYAPTIDRVLNVTSPGGLHVAYHAMLAGYASPGQDEPFVLSVRGLSDSPCSSSAPLLAGP